ncbi:MAG: hypothetical protein KDK99_14765 [Verrucomicrobiales bacterium]|nr:hypothetical protein [Verrucomicrobiales bacterium]
MPLPGRTQPVLIMNRLCTLPLISLLLVGCNAFPKQDKFQLSVHAEGSEMESPRSIMPDFIGDPPRQVILMRAPEFSQKNIAAVQPFPADNGNAWGVGLKLDFKGTQALDLVTRMRHGEYLRTLVNGRGADWVRIDRPISDGIFIVWEGVPEKVIAEMKKRYPPINNLGSSATNQDMTPTTWTEKRKAFGLFRKEEKAKEREARSAVREPAAEASPPPNEREAAAAIQPPTSATSPPTQAPPGPSYRPYQEAPAPLQAR